jgi:TPR repeat protein
MTRHSAAAAAGNTNSQWKLGFMLATGKGTPQDTSAARTWYLRAAKRGSRTAQFTLGDFYENNAEIMISDASNSDADAQVILGNMYSQGQGVELDYTEAGRWWLKAADQGNAAAQFNLGLQYVKGVGVAQDYARWFRKAASQGYEAAQDNLKALRLVARSVK